MIQYNTYWPKLNKLERKIILGTVQMGLDYGINNASGKISFEDSFKILQKAFDLGIETLDTAEGYGNAHQVIGNFHKMNPAVKFKVITKVPHAVKGSEIADKVNTYIKDLNVDYLEVLMFHSFDSYDKNKGVFSVLNNLKRQGVIKKIGVSVYTNDQVESLLSNDDVSIIQMPFNLLDNSAVRGDLMKRMKVFNKEVHTRSAFLQGLFFKKEYNDSISKQLTNELDAIKDIVHEERTSMTNLALSYCLAQSNIDKVLIGVDSVAQLVENIKASDYEISSNALSNIDAVKVNNTDLLNPSLWK